MLPLTSLNPVARTPTLLIPGNTKNNRLLHSTGTTTRAGFFGVRLGAKSFSSLHDDSSSSLRAHTKESPLGRMPGKQAKKIPQPGRANGINQ